MGHKTYVLYKVAGYEQGKDGPLDAPKEPVLLDFHSLQAALQYARTRVRIDPDLVWKVYVMDADQLVVEPATFESGEVAMTVVMVDGEVVVSNERIG